MLVPNYVGGGLINLVAELERRLAGDSPSPGLSPDLAARIEEASTYVLVLFDGLGDRQLDHPSASSLSDYRIGSLHAPFCTTTTVSLASVATALAPAQHGVLGHLMWMPEVGRVVNTLKWVDLTGAAVPYDTTGLLPTPNLWERLHRSGAEPITVQPSVVDGTALTWALYRGCRFEPAWTDDEFVEATTQLAAAHRRLIFTYLPHVDFAAHVHGQESLEYEQAVRTVGWLWERIVDKKPPEVAVIGVADHGVVECAEAAKFLIRGYPELTFFGDPRTVLVKGPARKISELADAVPGRLYAVQEAKSWWGGEPAHPQLAARLPDAVLLAHPDHVLLPPGFDRRLRGYHGGLRPEEVEVPLLVG